MRRLLPLVALGVVLAGCGGEDESSSRSLIPVSAAADMKKYVARAGELSALGTCGGAKDNVGAARNELVGLRRLDPQLKDNLNAWLDHLREQIDAECERPEEKATPTPTPSPTPEATPTETATPEPTVATPTPTPSSTPPPEAPPVEPPDTGGVGADDGSDE